MTLAALVAFLKLLVPFLVGFLANEKLRKGAQAQANNRQAEDKASDPASGNDVTDLDKIP